MPEISRFLGIVIAMYYRDHAPPHFHALYGDYEVTVGIAAGEVNGDFPKRARSAHWHTCKSDVPFTAKSCWLHGHWPA